MTTKLIQRIILLSEVLRNFSNPSLHWETFSYSIMTIIIFLLLLSSEHPWIHQFILFLGIQRNQVMPTSAKLQKIIKDMSGFPKGKIFISLLMTTFLLPVFSSRTSSSVILCLSVLLILKPKSRIQLAMKWKWRLNFHSLLIDTHKNVFQDSTGTKDVTVNKTGSIWPSEMYIQWHRQISKKELHNTLKTYYRCNIVSPKFIQVSVRVYIRQT